MALYNKYCQNHNREALLDIYVLYDDFHNQALWYIRESYQPKVPASSYIIRYTLIYFINIFKMPCYQ